MSRKPPRWDDTDAVERRVADELVKAEYRVEEYEVPPMQLPPPRVPDFNKEQQEAVAAAEQGNVEPLAHLMLDWTKPRIDLSTFWLLLNLLHAGSPKPKRRRGRPTMNEDVLFSINPLNAAAVDVTRIFHILKGWYPKRDHILKSRAIAIAAKWHEVDRDRLANYAVPSKRDRS